MGSNYFFNNDLKIIVFTSGKLKQNCFIVKDLNTKEIIVIDPGSDPEKIIEIINKESGILRYILLTHGHYDHVGAVKELVDYYNIKYYIHKNDIKLLKRAALYSVSLEKRNIEFSSDYSFYGQGDIILGKKIIEIIHVPGHTPGSVIIKINKVFFSGDLILLDVKEKNNLPGYNKDIWKLSLEVLLNEASEDTVFCLGHGSKADLLDIKNFLD